MKKGMILIIVALMAQLAFAAGNSLPSAAEIASAFDVEMTNGVHSVKETWIRINPLMARAYTYNQEPQSSWYIERDAVTNLFLRCCALNFPTNDIFAYSDFCRLMEIRILCSFESFAMKSDRFCDLVLAQLPRFSYWEYPPKPQELKDGLILGALGAGGWSVVIYGNPQTGERDPVLTAMADRHRAQVRHLMNLNDSQKGIRRGLIRLVRPMVERKAASLSDAEWTTFTNSVSTTAALTRDEQDRLFKDLRQ